jgi:site-specific DNA recombinase
LSLDVCLNSCEGGLRVELAALYLRSSKDRKDVSIEVQRQTLHELAARRSLAIVEEFADVVESGKDEDRPGFQRLLSAVANPRRGWSTLLVLDTSRLARSRRISVLFEEVECLPRGIRVIYKTLPEDMDEATEVIVKSNFQAIDQWHSITSRQKGLAGMAQNVASGFRAGGRAPFGYQLHREPTGAIRDGAPVTKSKLVESEDAPRARAYLKARASGVPRALAALKSGITLNKSSLCGIEWNALTYAGHTVWNVHAPRQGARAIGGKRRRPRSEWKMQRDTHAALITDAEAEAILIGLTRYSLAHPRDRGGKYLLSGLLCTPAGKRWIGEPSADSYRTKGRYVKREPLERAVINKVMGDLSAPQFVDAILAAARKDVAGTEQQRHGRALRERAAELATRISRMMDMAAQMAQPGPALRKIEELEAERVAAVAALDRWEAEQAQCTSLARLDSVSVRRALDGLARDLQDHERDQLKGTLAAMVERIELDPATFACQIHYRIRAGTDRGLQRLGGGGIERFTDASPWGRHPKPLEPVRLVMPLLLRDIHPALERDQANS